MRKRVLHAVCLFMAVSVTGLPLTSAELIPDQPGRDILCTGRHYTYAHDVRQGGVDVNLAISGDAGFRVEDAPGALASYYTDDTKGGEPAVFTYTFVAEPGAVFDDVSVTSLARIFNNGCSVIGHYRIGDSNWTEFLSLTISGTAQPVDVFENIHDSRFAVRYTLSWDSAYWADSVQLFRSWGPEPGQPGSFTFTFEASLITDVLCDRADLAGHDAFIDGADAAALAADFGVSGSDLAGDINRDGDCDILDLQWLAERWLCSSYEPIE